MEGTGKKSAIHSHHCSSYLPPAEGSSNAQTVWKCWFHLLFSPYNRPSNKFQKSALPSPPLYIPRPLTQYLHGAIEQREHLASQGSKTVHLIQQEAHLFSADPNNPESTEALGQHWLTSLYGCPNVARWPSRTQFQRTVYRNSTEGKRPKTRVLLSPLFPPACQWASRVKDLGQPEWKGLCLQAHWHVYHLPEFHIKEGRRGWDTFKWREP